MKLSEFSWQREGDRQVLDCKIAIEEDGTYTVHNSKNPTKEKAGFFSPDDLGRALSETIEEAQTGS